MSKNKVNIQEEVARCLLCIDAPCSKACGKGDVARALRAIRFDNATVAKLWTEHCSDEDLHRAEQACIHYDHPVRIKEVINQLPEADMPKLLPSLEIDFCGLHCENPFFLASSSICTGYDMVARAFEAGWAGVFYKTICLDDINEVSPRFDAIHREGSKGDFTAFRNMEQLSENPTEVDFEILSRLKKNYPSKIVIASIMGSTEEQWIELAKMAEQAGVDAIELNFSCPQMRIAGMGSDVGQDPELVTFYTAYVKRSVSIPVIPKMTPNITQINNPAMGAYFAGADAISAINTIKSITFGESSEVSGKKTTSGLSGRAVKPIAQRHILEMAKNPIMKKIEVLELNKEDILVEGYDNTPRQVPGKRTTDSKFEETKLCFTEEQIKKETARCLSCGQSIVDENKCIGCGRCHISCMDAGHQAISFDNDTRKPQILGSKCVGCHLCRLVCPTGAITSSKRVPKKKEH